MKTFLTQILSLIVCIVAAATVEWVVVNWVLGPLPFGLGLVVGVGVFAYCWRFRSRTVPLLLSIQVGTALSWVSLYMFWFAVWMFHSVAAARVCEALGSFILLPARWVVELIGGDQSTEFSDPILYFGANGLIVGILIYWVFRTVSSRRAAGKNVEPAPAREGPVEARVG